jgi:hypothetical protein
VSQTLPGGLGLVGGACYATGQTHSYDGCLPCGSFEGWRSGCAVTRTRKLTSSNPSQDTDFPRSVQEHLLRPRQLPLIFNFINLVILPFDIIRGPATYSFVKRKFLMMCEVVSIISGTVAAICTAVVVARCYGR